MKKKHTYESPLSETFIVRFEGYLCYSPGLEGSDEKEPFDPWDQENN